MKIQIIHVEHTKRSTEENIVMERERATRHIQAMEGLCLHYVNIFFDDLIPCGFQFRFHDSNETIWRTTQHILTCNINFPGKLKDLQDMLFDKMKELNAARIQNLPLKAEVESLRTLIDEEEKRQAMYFRVVFLKCSKQR